MMPSELQRVRIRMDRQIEDRRSETREAVAAAEATYQAAIADIDASRQSIALERANTWGPGAFGIVLLLGMGIVVVQDRRT